jgi:hypothetical protein
MKSRFVLLALATFALGLSGASAKAQVGLYFNPVVAHVHIGTADYGSYSFLGDGVTSRWFAGVDYGGYYDFFHRPGFAAGVDVRDTILHGNNADLNTFSVGARLAANPIKYGFRPYVELDAGAGRSKPELSTLSTTKAQFDILGGLDYPLGKHVDLRAIEIGYGNVQTISSQIERDNTSIPSASLIHISTGLVFRFGK